VAIGNEPSCEDIDGAAAQAREAKVGFVIGFGGGSVVDSGKAIAMLVGNGGNCLDYMEVIGRGLPILRPSLPYIAIPTTSGTGAEVTKNAVVKSNQHRQKASLRSEFMLPTIALVDPQLTISAPPEVTASTGLDAFIQCLEPYVSPAGNPITDIFAAKGLEYGSKGLRAAYLDGKNLQAREQLALCSVFGGLALANAKLGAVHGFAGVLGGVSDTPHGAICAAMLSACIRINTQALHDRCPDSPALRKYENAARIVCANENASVADLCAWVDDTCRLLQIPPLAPLPEDQVADVVEKSANSSSMKGNPIVLTQAELLDMLRSSST
jgi:alcohol dehydrogenase class IV